MCLFTVLEVSGAEGLVRETISWMARRSLRRCRGLLMPISLWISVSDSADMMAPLFTLARQAATYQAGIPTHSWREPSTQSMSAPRQKEGEQTASGWKRSQIPPAMRRQWDRPTAQTEDLFSSRLLEARV